MERRIRPPEFDLEDTADYYAFYVLILSLPESLFWYCDCSFVRSVADNMAAYNGWRNYAEYKERKQAEQRNKRHRR